MRDQFAVILLCAIFALALGRAGGEDVPPSPILPKSDSELFSMVLSERDDFRQAAYNALLVRGKVQPSLLNDALVSSGETAKPLLYMLAAKFGNAATLDIVVERIRVLPFRSFEYVRAMECVLALGAEYPLPIDLIPNLLVAWLEGDASFAQNAPLAIRRLGGDALPELIRLLRNSDEDSMGAAIELMLETGVISRPDLERACKADPMISDIALDTLAAYFTDFQPLAREVLRSESAGLAARKNALWWLVYCGNAPTEAELRHLIENEHQTLASEAALALDYKYPAIAAKRSLDLMTGKAELTYVEAAAIASLPTQDSVRMMMLARCAADAMKIRDTFKSKYARDGPMSDEEFIRVFCPSFATTDRYIAARFYRIAQAFSRAYNIDCAAKACSDSLMLSWDRQAATRLSRLMAEYPDLDAKLFLAPFFRQRSKTADLISETDTQFAQALMGVTGGYAIVESFYRASAEVSERWSMERFVN